MWTRLEHNPYVFLCYCLFPPFSLLLLNVSHFFLTIFAIYISLHPLPSFLLTLLHLSSTPQVWEQSTWPPTDRTRTDAPFLTTNWTHLAGLTPLPDHSLQSTRDQIRTSPPKYCLTPVLTAIDKISAQQSSTKPKGFKAPTGPQFV